MVELRHHRAVSVPTLYQGEAGYFPIDAPAWQREALCGKQDGAIPLPDAWFPDFGGPHASKPAKRICAACPVRMECLEAAIERNERFGVWGGLSTPERDDLVEERAKCASSED